MGASTLAQDAEPEDSDESDHEEKAYQGSAENLHVAVSHPLEHNIRR